MAPMEEKSQLKRGRQSVGEEADGKRPRRSDRLQQPQPQDVHVNRVKQNEQGLPSPVTHKDSTNTVDTKDGSSTSSNLKQQITPKSSPILRGLASPPQDTQPLSQFIYPPKGTSYEVDDEEGKGVWGYLVPISGAGEEPMVLMRRTACPAPGRSIGKTDGKQAVGKKAYEKQEESYEQDKMQGISAGGYLIGRHPECDRVLNVPTVSNRHCLLFSENKGGDAVAVLEDLSGNGTFVNDAYVGRNKRRQLEDGDEVSILNEARFVFRYPHRRGTNGFRQQYVIQEALGKGHFATVYLCIEKATGNRYAVKKFEKRSGPQERSKVEGLQQEIAVLMSVSHPNMLCLKDSFDEKDGVYLVLELAPEGELFNWIVMKQKLTESESRKIFVQLFQGVKYLHERNIVHRDIKPENILLVDKELTVKLADFGLAKIIGEESFTTTLCGTPSYVAPEILENSNHRRYTRAVDIWSLGVVLYICLCGFPPFSDELYTPENPYTLSQQIKMGRFDYPSPYWDSVGDPALDLIDRMLTVDVEKRIDINGCLEHPWTIGSNLGLSLTDSTDGLTGALSSLDFSKRKIMRERTMLSAINDIKITRVIPIQPQLPPIKVFEKNVNKPVKQPREFTPSKQRNPDEFMEMGGKGDQVLFGDDGDSRYTPGAALKNKNGHQNGRAT